MKIPMYVLILTVIVLTRCDSQSNVREALFTHADEHVGIASNALMQETQQVPQKSVALAVALSLVVPGAGELYAGNFGTGKYAMVAEAAIWITYAAFYTHGNWVRNDAQLFATQHAGANFTSKDHQFNVDIGNYLSVDEYNQAKLRTRANNLLYTDPSFYWKWDSDADRIQFKNARIRSDQIFQSSKFVIAAAVVNRIFSAFSAGRAASEYNKKMLFEGAWNLKAYPNNVLSLRDGITLDLSYDF